MPLHRLIQGLLLLGLRFERARKGEGVPPPRELAPLIAAIAPAHQAFNAKAIRYGDRYRSAFWSIYLLSALAVLCAVLPLALGWDDDRHFMHPYAGAWALGEVMVIGAVALLYGAGHRRDWQGNWLGARTRAELAWYLPLVAPLVDFSNPQRSVNWYATVFDPSQPLLAERTIEELCRASAPAATAALAGAWARPGFGADYARWAASLLAEQRHYHERVARRQHALLHRVHGMNSWLFGLTAFGALMHLMVHSVWLTLVTVFFPALGASLHGALAQSESYRLAATSERLVFELGQAIARFEAALRESDGEPDEDHLKAAAEAALALILDEHLDWHMLVRPHHLPLA